MEDNSHLWPDIEIDGWTYAHNAIRLDLKDTIFAVNRIYNNNKVEKWELEHLLLWWRRVYDNINMHHDHEERLFFPFLKSKIDIPDKVSDDHRELNRLVLEVSKRIIHLCNYSQVIDLLESLEQLDEHMCEHLLEEEHQILPLLRKHFTPKELKPTIDKMVSEFKWYELPHYYRQLKIENQYDKGQILEHTQNVLEIPGCIFKCCIWRNFSKYENQYGYLIHELKYPEEKKKLKKRGCLCF